jgi:hypothetical protein
MNSSDDDRPRITATDPVIVGLPPFDSPQPAPDRDEARLLVRSYQTEAAHLDAHGAHDRALFLQGRADQLRRTL